METLKRISELKVIPVIKIDHPETALPLGEALLEGGLAVAEITLRSPHGLKAIAEVAVKLPKILVGAGTILSPEDADKATEAGARFLVTPGFNPKVVEHCLKRGYLIIPGLNSPSGVEAGLEFGLTHLKFFPAEQSGGQGMLKALAGPYSQVKFMPSGGVNVANAAAYLSLANVFAVGGSWMVGEKLLANRDYATITKLCSEATNILAANA